MARTTRTDTASTDRGIGASPLIAIAVLCFSSLSAALMQSLVIPIQSDLPDLLQSSASSASWVVTATLLAGGVSMPVTGRLADIHGKKPVLVFCAVTLLAGSLICAVSFSLFPMLIGRVLQGIAMGYIPVAISMAKEVAPAHLVNGAVAAISATLGVGGALGLPLAAWIAQSSDWHLLFWTSAVLAVVMTLASVFLLPHAGDRHPARMDWTGAVGLGLGIVGVLVGVSKGAEWGWGSLATWASIGLGIVVLLVWGWYEVRLAEPLVDLRSTARRPVLLTNIAAVLIGFGMMAQSIVVPQLLEMPDATGYGLGQTILEAGIWMAPGGLMMMLFSPISARMLTRYGARSTLVVAGTVIAAGYLCAVFLTGSAWEIMIATCIICAGVGIGYAAMPTLIMGNVPAAEAASGIGVNSLMRSVGTTTAGAVMALVLTSSMASPSADLGPVPTEGAFHACFVLGAAAAAVAAVIVLFVPKPHVERSEPDTEEDSGGDDGNRTRAVSLGS